jgi:hypothetical protein
MPASPRPQQITPINRKNVGRIAERIVSNELESRGFRVSDLNRDGTSANADLLAVAPGKTLQIQVKGATNGKNDRSWWVQYGYCTDDIINDRNKTMFNRHSSFYKADFVVLVAVRSPREYCCVVLSADIAEKAAQNALDRDYRIPKRNGDPKKPNKVWIAIDRNPKSLRSNELLENERTLLEPYRDRWETIGGN